MARLSRFWILLVSVLLVSLAVTTAPAQAQSGTSITSVTPNSSDRGEETTLTVSGTGLQGTEYIYLNPQEGFGSIYPTDINVNADGTQLTANLYIPTYAKPGLYDMVLYDGEFNETASGTGVFTVGSNVPPDDGEAPTVEYTDPSDGGEAYYDEEIAYLGGIEAAFSEPLGRDSVNSSSALIIKNSSGQNVTSSFDWGYYEEDRDDDGTPEYLINVYSSFGGLDPDETYTVTLKGGENGIKDLYGNPMAEDYSWSFGLTSEQPGGGGQLEIDYTYPSPDSTNFPIGESIEIDVSYKLDESSLTPESFTLLNSETSETVAGSASVEDGGYSLRFTPDSNLEKNTNYTAVVKGGADGVKSLSGRKLAEDYAWSFTTSSVEITSVTPENVDRGRATQITVEGSGLQAIEDLELFDPESYDYYYVREITINEDGTNLTANLRVRYSATPGTYTLYAYNENYGTVAVSRDAITVNDNSPPDDDAPPSVTSTSPEDGGTVEEFYGDFYDYLFNVSADFSEPLDGSTVESGFTVEDAQGNDVTERFYTYSEENEVGASVVTLGIYGFDSMVGETYTVTLKGGENGIKDLYGNPMAEDYSWTFTVVGEGDGGSEGSDLFVYVDGFTQVRAGVATGYEVGFGNIGGQAAENVALVNTVENGVFDLEETRAYVYDENFDSVEVEDACRIREDGDLICEFGTLAASDSGYVDVGVRPTNVGTMNVSATISGTTADEDPSNDNDRFEAEVVPCLPEGLDTVRSGFCDKEISPNDDGSSESEEIGFPINFYGNTHETLFVNNNGNVTFDEALEGYTPEPIEDQAREIIAPFWADVDTRESGSRPVIYAYGESVVNGRNAFGVNWVDVGYFSRGVDKLNSFQLVLVDRSDTGAGNFDIEFNYDKVQWETGGASGGTGGLGGSSARAGFSNGSEDPGTSYELPGSAVNGAFLDSNNASGLVHNSFNSSKNGRYVYEVRNGQVQTPTSNLSVEKTVDEANAQVGERLTYDITATNNGPDPATGVTLSDALSEKLQFVSVTPGSGGSCEGTSEITCSFESIPNNGSATVEIVAEVGAEASGEISNTASASATERDLDPDNNESESVITNIGVSPQPPTLDLPAASDSGSSSTDNITNVQKPTFTGTAESGSTVKVFDGATQIGTTTAAGNGSWSFTPAQNIANGSHSITATATNAFGSSQPSGALEMVVDTAAPVVNITSGPNGPTRETSATFEFNSESGAAFACRLDGGNFENCTSPKTYSGLSSGLHTFTVRATDVAGNISPNNRNWNVDSTPPGAPTLDLSAASDSGVSNTDNITNVQKPTFTGTAESGSTVKVFDGATQIGTTTAAGNGSWSFTPAQNIANGSHAIQVKASDAVGNESALSAVLNVRIDVASPSGTVKINNGAASTKKAAVTLNLSAADDSGGSGMSQTRIRNAGKSWSAWMPYSTTKPWTLASGTGNRTVNVEFRDTAGNVSATASDSIKIAKKKKK